MFEISIFCVILLAISYWAVLWVMGRREDVLHGEFVEAGAQAHGEDPARPVLPERSIRPIFPDKPVSAIAPATAMPKPVLKSSPVIAAPAIAEAVAKPSARTPINEVAVRASAAEQPAFRPERLESLLNSIKQDLNQLVQK